MSIQLQYNGKSYAIENEFIVGRDQGDLACPQDRGMSRIHFKLIREQSELWITDLDSTNGTIVNGQKLAKGQTIKLVHGDLIKAHSQEFSVTFAQDIKDFLPKSKLSDLVPFESTYNEPSMARQIFSFSIDMICIGLMLVTIYGFNRSIVKISDFVSALIFGKPFFISWEFLLTITILVPLAFVVSCLFLQTTPGQALTRLQLINRWTGTEKKSFMQNLIRPYISLWGIIYTCGILNTIGFITEKYLSTADLIANTKLIQTNKSANSTNTSDIIRFTGKAIFFICIALFFYEIYLLTFKTSFWRDGLVIGGAKEEQVALINLQNGYDLNSKRTADTPDETFKRVKQAIDSKNFEELLNVVTTESRLLIETIGEAKIIKDLPTEIILEKISDQKDPNQIVIYYKEIKNGTNNGDVYKILLKKENEQWMLDYFSFMKNKLKEK